MNNPLAEIRAIRLRLKELEKEKMRLQQREDEILDLTSGTRKSQKDMVTPKDGKTLFASIREKSYEYSKAQ